MEKYRAKAKAKYYALKAKESVQREIISPSSGLQSTFPEIVRKGGEIDQKTRFQPTSLSNTKKREYCDKSSAQSSSIDPNISCVDLNDIVGCNHPRSMVCLDCTGLLDEEMRKKLSTKPMQQAYKILSSIFAKTTPSDARILSELEAKIFKAEGRSISTRMLTYGEVTFRSFSHILMRVKSVNPYATHFCDLGSGTGKAVLIAAIAIGFQRCTGVEIVKSLHNVAEERLQELTRRLSLASSPSSSSSAQESCLLLERTKSVTFVNEDMFNTKSLSSSSTTTKTEALSSALSW
eukprot:CAMPEP_0185269636 /NCGR_PEP_ID=MMETSP1359-20130426/40376_1 /TAXON_ID=552665 /ORGANISM="Bigelowiella longifila, Strain CCMP242" /LENGTH=291 /DNA_ID=CAMNT_0027860891 /DNA_START=127 /DNA_END=999 /DNA_ORIENTATION=+